MLNFNPFFRHYKLPIRNKIIHQARSGITDVIRHSHTMFMTSKSLNQLTVVIPHCKTAMSNYRENVC